MRIVVAMSGGVDSATVAALLHEAGHEVIGATMQLYDHGAAAGRKGACCAGADILDARAVADRLGFPHYVLDYEARFRRAVIEPFAAAYAAGETPIPCIACNRGPKFSDLLGFAQDLGAEALATGHYARIIDGADGPELHRAVDPARDQSYFLAHTTRAQLAQLRFPLGAMTKQEVRAEAARLGLGVAAKPDSQDICFAPHGRHAEVVARLRPEAARPGEILHRDGRVLGRHRGLAHYTVGQARGLGLDPRDGTRLFVLRLDAARNAVIVGPEQALGTREVGLRDVNWLIDPPGGPMRVSVKLRGREQPRLASLLPPSPAPGRGVRDHAMLAIDSPATAAPGQAAVIYDGSRVVAGATIAPPASVLQDEGDLHRHAVLRDPALRHRGLLFQHVQAGDAPERPAGARQALAHGIVEALGRGGGDLRDSGDCDGFSSP
jgi:tRNA-specific 2-thiouridylase